MIARRLSLALSTAFLFPSLLFALDKEEKQWVEGVKPMMLADEEKLFGALKSKEDRAEFQKIFWARRDPDLLTPLNEFQATYDERRAKAKQEYSMKGPDNDAGIFLPIPGDQSDCGLVYITLGAPGTVTPLDGDKKTRKPERWTYTTPVRGDFSFDGHCRFPAHGADKTREQLKQFLILQTDVNYHVEKGKLTKKLDEMLPKPGPAQALLLQPRQDFDLANQPAFVKIQEGGTGLFGLLKGDATGLTTSDVAGKKKAKILIRAEAKGASNVINEREALVDVSADNKFLASYRLGLRAGSYELKVAAVDPVSNKGSVVTQTLEVPDYNTGELTIGTLFALEDIQEATTQDPLNPYSAFEIGNVRLVPRFGNVFKQSDSLQISYQFYDPKVDETTKKPAAVAKLQILKSTGGVAAEAPEQEFDTPVAGSAVGPVPLEKYTPGKYKVVLKVTDKVAQKDYTQEATFEVAK
jgi:GWxTD domain-containing protein